MIVYRSLYWCLTCRCTALCTWHFGAIRQVKYGGGQQNVHVTSLIYEWPNFMFGLLMLYYAVCYVITVWLHVHVACHLYTIHTHLVIHIPATHLQRRRFAVRDRCTLRSCSNAPRWLFFHPTASVPCQRPPYELFTIYPVRPPVVSGLSHAGGCFQWATSQQPQHCITAYVLPYEHRCAYGPSTLMCVVECMP